MQKPNLHMYLRRQDPFIGKYSFVKVCSGRTKGDDVLYNAEADAEENRASFIRCGNKPTEVSELFAGDIGAIAKLGSTKTGDTLSDKEYAGYIFQNRLFGSIYLYEIQDSDKGDEDKASGNCRR